MHGQNVRQEMSGHLTARLCATLFASALRAFFGAPQRGRYASMNVRSIALALIIFSSLVLAGEAQNKPRLPYHDWGACPFECCTYREWVAKVPVTVFRDRNEKGAVAFHLKKNERVHAITGVVVTHKVGVTEIIKPIEIGYLPSGEKAMLSLKPKDVVYTLHYAGEGHDVFWYKGKTYVDQISVPDNAWGDVPNSQTVKVLSRPEYDWWAKIRNHAGQIGWTRQTDKFGNKDACG